MPKKTIILLCGLVVLVALGFYGFSKWSEAREKVNLWTLVPDDAVFIAETNNAPQFIDHLQDSDLWATVSQMPYVLRLQDQLAFLDSLSVGRSQLRNFVSNKSILVSMHVLGRTEQDFVYYVPVNTVAEHRYVRTLVENIGKAQSYRQEVRDYQGFQITDITSEDNTGNLSFFSHHNNLVISASPVLVEEIVRKINRGQLESPAKDYKNTNYLSQPDVYANVFINYQHLPDLLGTFLKDGLQDDVNLLSSLCRNSMLELKMQNNRLFLNGFSNPETIEGSLFSRMKGHKPKGLKLRELVPARTAVLLHLGLDQVSSLRRVPGEKVITTFLDTLANTFRGELGLCYLEAHDSRTPAEKILFVQSGNPVLTQTLLNRMQPGISAGTQEKHGANTIRLLTINELPQQLFGDMFKGFEQTYYTSVQNYMLFTDDVATMRTLLNDIDAGRIWSKTGAMEPVLEEMQQENNFGLFVNTANAWNLLLRAVNPDKQDKLLANSAIFKKFHHLSFQFSAVEDQYYTSLILRHQEESGVKAVIAEQGMRQIEKFNLHNLLITEPFLTQHPIDKSSELVVQDSSFVLQAISAEKGKQNWVDSISAPVMGPVQQFIYGPDKRLAYFFATPTRIYCIDRNGKDLENFPFNMGDSIRLQRLTVFDYDKNADYRLVVDDALGNVFIVDMQGNLQQGWGPMRLDSRLAAAPQHFKVNGRNVLLMVLENGYIYAFDTQGQVLPGFPLNLESKLNSMVFGKIGVSYRRSLFTTVTASGLVVTFNLTGEISKREQLVRPDRRSVFELVQEPSGKSYIIARTDPGRVALYSQDLKLLLDRRFVTSSRKEVQYFHFGGDRKLYIVNETGPRKAYLFDVQAQPLGNDPINTAFPVGVQFNEVKNQFTIFSTLGTVVQKTIVQGR